jgi:tetratricopeptide (TPR) repeat protein
MIATGAVHADCEVPVGKFASITGSVDVQPSGGGIWAAAKLESRLCEGDTIRVGERSRAAVSLINDAVLRIDQNTAMRLIDITPQDEEQSLLDLFKGAFQSFSRKPKFLKVNTPYLNGSVEGTEFVFRVDDDEATITMLEGVVLASNNQGELRITPGESAQASKGKAPQKRVVVKPRDLVQWGLYYPPVLAAAGLTAASPAISEAANCAANGNNACAFAALDKVPQTQRDAQYLLLRSTVLLSAGRVDEARAEIDAALQKDANSGAAYALRAVIAVALNDNEAALADARRAVELSPQSAAATIALSYALQANLQLGAARSALLELVGQQPDDALAWARLAELHLMLGDRREATAAAERAVALQPGLGRTQSVLGFTALAAIDTAQAQAAFEQAIALDSADPLPRLGLGLAKIRRGQLDEGRSDLEAAVALDSNNALLRAYLGKAYFEEKRGPLDATQFEVAKELDPLDPTAFFYNAIRLQTENRPVEALRELEASIERNDNRAVYRGRLLLDKDRAARGTSLARVFDNLGFDRLGLNESAKSLTFDPTNSSAHRFRSDSYRAQSRREISRVSELLQAQMFQDVNMNPIQPSIASSSLNIVTAGGPTSPGFNEFTPLFEKNTGRLDVSGFLGSNDTHGGEVVASGVFDKVSLSAGGYAFDTDGFRENNDLEHRIFDIYGQWAINPSVNVQAEYRNRDTEHGDIFMNFDPTSFDPARRDDIEEETLRFGLRVTPSERSTVLLSAIFGDRDFTRTSRQVVPAAGEVLGGEVREFETGGDDSEQFEGLYAFKSERFNVVAGGAYSRVEIDDKITSDISLTIDPPAITIRNCLNIGVVPPVLVPVLGGGPCPPGPFLDLGVNTVDPPPFSSESTQTFDAGSDVDDYRFYAYGNVEVMPSLTATLGLSYTDFEDRFGEFDKWNPKFGLQWDLNEKVRLRGAFFKVVKPALASNRLLEPTQVAGFNQFFDDGNATRSERVGVAVDWSARHDLFLGGEFTRRDIEHRNIDLTTNRSEFQDRDEESHSAYVYWTPSERWALSAKAIYDKFETDSPSLTIPSEVTTRMFPLKALYFHPSGLFAEASVSYVNQDVRRGPNSTLAQGDSSFGVVGLGVGYRLPKRRGIVSLSVDNLFDREMKYQDDSYRNFNQEPSGSPFVPERTIMARATFSF